MTLASAPELSVVADVAVAAAAQLIALRPRSIALAGGRTPRALYERLGADDLPWAELDLWFGDERCVPVDHPDSNEGMARAALLDRVPARVHSMAATACDPAAYESALGDAFGGDLPRLDVALLGLGADGHTASLFPGDPALDERERLVARVERPDHPRLTLTLPVLSAAAEALFLVTGDEKREALRRLLDGDDIPAARVRAGRVRILADREAAP